MDNNYNNINNGQPVTNYQPVQNYQSYSKIQMKTDRSMIMYIILTMITCGIYGIYFYAKIGDDMNIIASRRDGQKTLNYWLVALLLNGLTCGILGVVWFHCISERVGDEARARGINTNFGASTYWLWYVLGSFLCGIGPFVYLYKLCQTMNDISKNYNAYGM